MLLDAVKVHLSKEHIKKNSKGRENKDHWKRPGQAKFGKKSTSIPSQLNNTK